ncbi:MAG TPA: DUF4124 domain-containing protein [Noviherbaspirillum sp.]|nr:DUF4124 domain-containing protein [Noviherbaspirillum sp.]
MRRLLLTSLLSLSFSLPAFAAYKCEANGKITYSDIPCADGKQVEIAGVASVSETDAARARQQAKSEKAELARIERERRKEEAAADKKAQLAARNAAVKNSKCSSMAQRVKWSEEDAARATGKSVEKARLKARRLAESYELQCGK